MAEGGFNYQVRFTGPGFTAFERTFSNMARQVEDWTEPLEKIEADYYEMMRLRFAGEGAHEGQSEWAALSPKYAVWKAAEYPGAKILHLEGKLEAAATNPGAPGAIQERGPRRLAIWIERWVGGWNLAFLHQFGTRRMPARPIVQVGQPTRLRWVRIIRDWFYTETMESLAGLHRQRGETAAAYRRATR